MHESGTQKTLLETVAASNLLIVENNPYGELRYSGETVLPLKALDQRGQVVYLSTFSKILVPDFRRGGDVLYVDLLHMINRQRAGNPPLDFRPCFYIYAPALWLQPRLVSRVWTKRL